MPSFAYSTEPRAVRLRDGREVLIRQIAPDDKELLVRGLERLSPKSRYRRFLTPKSGFSSAELAYLTEVDNRDHVALLALDGQTGEAVGVARFVRERSAEDLAEVAVTVLDDWQGRGVGTALMESLTERAREVGLRAYTATVAADNAPILDLLERLGARRMGPAQLGAVQYEFELPGIGLGQTMRSALRAAAEGALWLPLPLRRVLLGWAWHR